MERLNDFRSQIYKKYLYSGYGSHFEGVYKLLGVLNVVCLAISAVLSAKFFEPYFHGFFGEYAIYAGFGVSALLALAIGSLMHRFLVYWHYQRLFDPMLGGLVLFLSIINIYGDYTGSQNYAFNIVGDKPKNTKNLEISNIYKPQIEQINSDIKEIESKNFYWCSEYGHSSKCGDNFFYIDPIKDKEAVAEINELKKQRSKLETDMSDQLSAASTNHQTALSDWSNSLNDNRSRFKFGSLVCTLLFLASSLWRLNYGVRFVSENNSETGGVYKNAKTQTVSDEAEAAFMQELKDNPDLMEEYLAMKELEKKN